MVLFKNEFLKKSVPLTHIYDTSHYEYELCNIEDHISPRYSTPFHFGVSCSELLLVYISLSPSLPNISPLIYDSLGVGGWANSCGPRGGAWCACAWNSNGMSNSYKNWKSLPKNRRKIINFVISPR